MSAADIATTVPDTSLTWGYREGVSGNVSDGRTVYIAGAGGERDGKAAPTGKSGRRRFFLLRSHMIEIVAILRADPPIIPRPCRHQPGVCRLATSSQVCIGDAVRRRRPFPRQHGEFA